MNGGPSQQARVLIAAESDMRERSAWEHTPAAREVRSYKIDLRCDEEDPQGARDLARWGKRHDRHAPLILLAVPVFIALLLIASSILESAL